MIRHRQNPNRTGRNRLVERTNWSGRMSLTSRIWQVDGVGHRLEGVLLDVKEVHRLQRRHCWMGVGVPY